MKQNSTCCGTLLGVSLPGLASRMAVLVLALAPATVVAQRVLVEWNFPTHAADAVADGGIVANAGREIATGGGVGAVTYTTGASTLAARAAAWNNGDTNKYWAIDFSTASFRDIALSSRQRSSNTGPRNFKAQYRVGGEEWTEIPGGDVTCADNWTSGVLSNLPFPERCADQPLISVRWLMVGNVSVATGTVTAAGASQIDDIIVRGTRISVPAPQALKATAVSATQFTANWTPVADVTGYELDVATNAAFSTEFPVNLAQNAGFETGDTSGWTVEPGFSVQGESPHAGNYAVKGVATATRRISQAIPIPAADGSTIYEISYWYRVAAGDGKDVRIWSSWNTITNAGTGDKLQPTTYNVSTSVWTRMVYTNMPESNTTNFQFEVRVYSDATVYLDSFSFRLHGPYTPSDFVPGYQSRPVAGPGPVVEGLQKGTYYYRARALDGDAASDDSNVIRVRASDTEPGFLLISR